MTEIPVDHWFIEYTWLMQLLSMTRRDLYCDKLLGIIALFMALWQRLVRSIQIIEPYTRLKWDKYKKVTLIFLSLQLIPKCIGKELSRNKLCEMWKK